MTPWLKRARAISDEVSARAYVDDLTSWSRDPVECVEHVTRLVELTRQFAEDTGLKYNVVKSRQFGTTAEIRPLLGTRSGPKSRTGSKTFGSSTWLGH
eukprot:14051174-Heterocapsa_arctica.AAC.1